MSESESELWRAPVGQLANLVVQDLVWNGETFATRLTKCSVSSL